MTRNRRAFLKRASVGALGAAAVLIPGQAEAFHRRQRIATCERQQPRRLDDNSVSICYPHDGLAAGTIDDPYQLCGGAPGTAPNPVAAFCAWGCYGANVSIVDAILVTPDTSEAQIAAKKALIALPRTWAYSFQGVNVGTKFKVKVSFRITGIKALQFARSGVCQAVGYM